MCGDCHILNTKELDSVESLLTSFNMNEDPVVDSDTPQCCESIVVHGDFDLEEEKMRNMGLPVSFGYDKSSEKSKQQGQKRRYFRLTYIVLYCLRLFCFQSC